MTALTWTDALAVGHAQIDQTHREFVELLGELDEALAAPAGPVAECLAAFAEHTQAHFAQEEAWMLELGYEADTCHFFQHKQVLQVVQAVQQRWLEQADRAIVALLVKELGPWFEAHAANLDAPLAEALQLKAQAAPA